MAINFPDSPSVNDTHTVGDRTWKWDGTVWNIVVGTTSDHGNLAGLSDDDHTQYLRTDGTRTAASLTVSGAVTVDTDTFVVDNVNDRVGIGTTSPDEKLTVTDGHVLFEAATDSGTVNIVSKTNAANAGNKIAFFAADRHDTDEEMAYIRPYLQTNSGGSGNVQLGRLAFGTSGSERMRIDSDGNVGIGTTSPAGTLDVNGKIHLTSGTDRYIEHRSGNNDILYSSDTGDFYRQDIANSSHEFFTDKEN